MDLSQDLQGFGIGTMADIEELRKALNVGYSSPVSGSDSIRVESLEASLKVVSYMATHIKLWNDIVKLDAFSTIEEYNRLNEYGSEGGGFVDAGVLPEEEDSNYSRETQKVKYVGTTRAVGHPTTLIRSVPADIIAQETNNGILWMLGKIEFSLFEGDETIIPVEWNGLAPQIVAGAGHVIDLRGAILTDDKVEEGADLVSQNFGNATKFYANNKVWSDFSKAYYDRQRWNRPPDFGAGMVGTPLKGMSTQAGDVGFSPDVFLRRGSTPPVTATSAKAPNAPTTGTFVVAANPLSQFVAADAGDYMYQVTAINQYGESAPSAISAAQTVAAGDSVAFVITDGGGTFGATGYKVYRTEKDGSITYFMVRKARASIANVYQATTAFLDLNADLPRTFRGFLLDMTEPSLAFKQLSPLIKMPLAVVSPAIRWMQLMYGTPMVFAPKKQVLYKNIGVS